MTGTTDTTIWSVREQDVYDATRRRKKKGFRQNFVFFLGLDSPKRGSSNRKFVKLDRALDSEPARPITINYAYSLNIYVFPPNVSFPIVHKGDLTQHRSQVLGMNKSDPSVIHFDEPSQKHINIGAKFPFFSKREQSAHTLTPVFVFGHA